MTQRTNNKHKNKILT